MKKIPSNLLSLAGEYRVCSELIKRQIFATITYGNHKSVDVYAICESQKRAVRIEVKSSQASNFVTNITQEKLTDNPSAPDFWVLVHFEWDSRSEFTERFFILTHSEICKVQGETNKKYLDKYRAKHGKDYDIMTGVDEIPATNLEQFENQWSKIVDDERLKRNES
jgi:hypothetical protein